MASEQFFDRRPAWKSLAAFKPTDLVRVGSPVTLINGRTVEKLGEVEVVGAEAGTQETLHFNTDLPGNLRPGDLLVDKSHMAAMTVTRCNFPGHRGRGVVAHNDAVIEDCKFSNQTNEAVLLMPEIKYTGEGPSASNVRVINNEMDFSWRQGRPATGIPTGAIRVSANAPPGDVPGIADDDIEISGNTISRSGDDGIVVNFTQKFVISKNRFDGLSGAAIAMQEVRGGIVSGNVCSPPRPVSIDPGSRDSVSFQGNSGLVL